VRNGPGAARTIQRFHTISARPSKEARMVGSTLGVYSFALIFVSARTNKRHHHLCLVLQYLLQSCSRRGRGIVEDTCYETTSRGLCGLVCPSRTSERGCGTREEPGNLT
jgi:hypothetical protein